VSYLYPGSTWEDDDDDAVLGRLIGRYDDADSQPSPKRFEKPAPKTLGGRPLVMNRDIK
jgi:hypothetical protein